MVFDLVDRQNLFLSRFRFHARVARHKQMPWGKKKSLKNGQKLKRILIFRPICLCTLKKIMNSIYLFKNNKNIYRKIVFAVSCIG